MRNLQGGLCLVGIWICSFQQKSLEECSYGVFVGPVEDIF